jgi:septal ring factor EnvC (AmiA/AmiB activator)
MEAILWAKQRFICRTFFSLNLLTIMAYSVNLLTTPADCDSALALAEARLRDLQHRADNLDYSRENSADSATEVQAELASLDAEITALNAIIPTLADGTKARKTNEVSLRRATNRQAILNDKQDLRGPVALLTRELDLAQMQAQITEANTFKTAITARRAAL